MFCAGGPFFLKTSSLALSVLLPAGVSRLTSAVMCCGVVLLGVSVLPSGNLMTISKFNTKVHCYFYLFFPCGGIKSTHLAAGTAAVHCLTVTCGFFGW